jgi:GWT1
MNKEGVMSILGYWALHLLGAALAAHVKTSLALMAAATQDR